MFLDFPPDLRPRSGDQVLEFPILPDRVSWGSGCLKELIHRRKEMEYLKTKEEDVEMEVEVVMGDFDTESSSHFYQSAALDINWYNFWVKESISSKILLCLQS